MTNMLMDRVLNVLTQRRSNLEDWLRSAPPSKKAIALGPAPEEAVVEHLETIEEAITKAEEGTLGECKVCHESVEQSLLEVDYTADVCIDHLSDHEIALLEDELDLAKTVQRALLPQEIPYIPGLDIAAYSRPAQFIGGDYFDFVNFSENFPGLVIADIAGHGVSASLQMASIQALTRAIAPTSYSPAEAISHIHRLFIHNISFTTFVTLFVASYDPETRILTYSNAGHNPPLVIHRNYSQGEPVSWLGPTGPAMGIIEDAEYADQSVMLQPGDLLVMYTDGVVEARSLNDTFFGSSRMVEVVERLYDRTPREIVRGIRDSLEEFVMDRPLEDDTTFLVCKVI